METETIVITQVDLRLDEIVFAKYGHLKYLEEILELNIQAIKQQLHLPLGMELKLPIYKDEPKIVEVEANKLW